MKKLFIAFCILQSAICNLQSVIAQQKYSRVKIFTDEKGLKELSASGVCIDHGDFKKNVFFISDFSEQEINSIKEKGFNYEIQIDDVQQFYKDQNNSSSEKHV